MMLVWSSERVGDSYLFWAQELLTLSCKINYLPLFYVPLNLGAIKKKMCRCFIEMKLWHNVTFAISTESLCIPIDPAVVIAT